MTKFKNKYRIESTRLKGWDYGSNGAYFITICTHNREHYFGNVVDGKMNVSEIGRIAESCWYEIPKHFPFVILGEFVVMPNHIHGIIIINKNNNPVETQNFASPPSESDPPSKGNKFGPQSKNLGSIVRGYKVGVKKYATQNSIEFQWQSRYHDHIIRNDISFNRISTYIQNNPKKWSEDQFYKKKKKIMKKKVKTQDFVPQNKVKTQDFVSHNKKTSKFLSLILRHNPSKIGLQLDENGWADVDELIQKANAYRNRLDIEMLKEVVKTNDKKRFAFNEDQTKIRANQGHSIQVDLEYMPVQPPEFLYHGTVAKFMDSIQEQGLLKMNRHHVHLSQERDTAIKVGSRRGKPIILVVRSGDMHRNGVQFYQSDNGVWLTEAVAPEFIECKE